MAYNEHLATRIRVELSALPVVEEKKMFGGVCFMVNGKMCTGVVKDEMMCRIDPAMEEHVFEMSGCRPMDFTGRPMKGYIYVSGEGLRTQRELKYWIGLCLEFNVIAVKSKKKARK